MRDLDGFDKHILSLLSEDSRRTGEQLAEIVGLSPAACLRRIQRLRKIGAIEREVAVVSPKFKEKGTTLYVLVTIVQHNPRDCDEFAQRLRRQEEVERLDWVTGDDDIVLVLSCASMDDFADFCEAYLHEAPVEGYKTLVSMRKYETGPLA